MENDNFVWKIDCRLKTSKNFENRPIHVATVLKYNALGKANAIADCLEDQFWTHEPESTTGKSTLLDSLKAKLLQPLVY